jgi:nucleoside-diphosphate kinase
MADVTATERTLIIIKPDGTSLGIEEPVFDRLKNELGLTLVAIHSPITAQAVRLRAHYAEHADRDFFPSLVDFMQSGPISVSIWSGPRGTVARVRTLVGSTNPASADPSSIRAQYGSSSQRNAIHASDSTESAEREIRTWFD